MAVGPQYDTTHVYVAPEDFDRFVASVIATFGGTTAQEGVATVTPTPSSTRMQLVLTPVGHVVRVRLQDADPVSIWFGAYRVSGHRPGRSGSRGEGNRGGRPRRPFNDPIGRDAVIQWPGGVNTQLYWHTTAPSYPSCRRFRRIGSMSHRTGWVRSCAAFSTFLTDGVLSDEVRAPGVEIGRPGDTYRRIRIESQFGKLTVLATDGHLPYPYGREMMGYEVTNLADTLTKATAAGVDVLVPPYNTDEREAVVVQFPGGYIAEVHSTAPR